MKICNIINNAPYNLKNNLIKIFPRIYLFIYYIIQWSNVMNLRFKKIYNYLELDKIIHLDSKSIWMKFCLRKLLSSVLFSTLLKNFL